MTSMVEIAFFSSIMTKSWNMSVVQLIKGSTQMYVLPILGNVYPHGKEFPSSPIGCHKCQRLYWGHISMSSQIPLICSSFLGFQPFLPMMSKALTMIIYILIFISWDLRRAGWLHPSHFQCSPSSKLPASPVPRALCMWGFCPACRWDQPLLSSGRGCVHVCVCARVCRGLVRRVESEVETNEGDSNRLKYIIMVYFS